MATASHSLVQLPVMNPRMGLAGKVVGKEETEVYGMVYVWSMVGPLSLTYQEDGQNEKLQNEEMSREIKEKRHQPYRGRFLQAGEFRYIQLGEPCLHLVSGPQSDIVK